MGLKHRLLSDLYAAHEKRVTAHLAGNFWEDETMEREELNRRAGEAETVRRMRDEHEEKKKAINLLAAGILNEVNEIQAQRDELLAILKALIPEGKKIEDVIRIDRLQALIARVEGKK